jgi:dihydroorotase
MTGVRRLFSAPAPKAGLLISRVHVVDRREAIDAPHDLLVRDGEIAEIAPPGALEAPAGVRVVHGEGLHCFPAFFDPHVHLRTPGQEYKEDVASGTAAAAAGGYAGIIAMPNTSPAIDSSSILRSVREVAQREAVVEVGFLPCITVGMAGAQLTEMAELRDDGALGFTDDGKPVENAGVLRRAMQYQRLCGGVLALHQEDTSLAGDGVMHEGRVSAALGMAGIPSLAESTPIARDAALARYEGARTHHQHLSCVESVEAVAFAKEHGSPVSAEVCPHHLCLTEEEVRSLETRFKMNPPLRTEADRLALIEGLRSGVIDCVSTDHAPHARSEKEVPFEEAPMGTTGLETAFAALHTELVLPGVLDLALLVERMSAGAELFALDAPRIAAGRPACLCLVDLAEEWEVGAEGYASRSENSAFAGRTLTGRVQMTLARGAVAFDRTGAAAGVAA